MCHSSSRSISRVLGHWRVGLWMLDLSKKSEGNFEVFWLLAVPFEGDDAGLLTERLV